MSQEKVDQHKADKKNRKKLNRQARLHRLAGYICAILVVLLLAAWVGYSVYNKVNPPAETESDLDMDALIDYLNSTQDELNQDAASGDDAAATDAAADTTTDTTDAASDAASDTETE